MPRRSAGSSAAGSSTSSGSSAAGTSVGTTASRSTAARHPAGSVDDPGQHGVPDRRRHLAGGRREHLGHQERVAGRGGGHRRRVDAGLGGQHRDRRVGESGQLQPDHRGAGQAADHPPERVIGAQLLLPIGDHQQCRQLRHPAGQRPQHVQGRLVGPVRVLDHDDRGPLGEGHLGQQRLEQRVPLAGADAERDAGQLPDHVPERAERPGGDQVLAGAAEQPGLAGRPVRELGQQAGLADPGLAGHEHDAARAPPRPFQGGVQSVELSVALQQPHDHSAEQPAAPGSTQMSLPSPERIARTDVRPGRCGRMTGCDGRGGERTSWRVGPSRRC